MPNDTVLLEQISAIIRNHFCNTHSFIHFLYQHFPDMVGNAVQASLLRRQPVYPSLTKREREVLELLAEGLCAKEIAQSLFISETTVITHKKNLKNKFKVKNTVELISKVYNLNEQAAGSFQLK